MRERGRQGGRERGREGGREAGREGGREGREEGKEGRKGKKIIKEKYKKCIMLKQTNFVLFDILLLSYLFYFYRRKQYV